MNFNLRIQIAVLIYLVTITALLYSNPKWFYTKNNELKPFGTGSGKTIFPLWLAILMLVIVSYYTSHLIMLVV